MVRILLLSLFIFLQISLFSQQNSTLFFMPNTPQANFVNPAVTNKCKLIIGLPILSSVHFNYGNSGFSPNQVLKKQSDGSYIFDGNSVMNKLGNVNFVESEFHTNLAYVGFWHNSTFFTFSINEKADLFLTYPGDLFALVWNGNTQFEGKTANLGKSTVALNYRREFAIGIARQTESDIWWGIRGKLLFGKLNTSFPKSKIDLYTDPITHDLTFNADWQMNTSFPISVANTANNTVESVRFNGNANDILFNRKNIGFATDLGFIKEIDDKVTVSGSVLDLGFISWKDNGYAFRQSGNYTYNGPLGDTIDDENFKDDLIRVIQEEFGISATPRSYIEMLNPRIYLGATYKLNDGLNAGVVATSKITRFRTTAGITLSLNKEFNNWFTGSVSYSYLNRSLKNVGLGFKVGQSPVQFYMVTDNVIGFISPMNSRNANLRFGLQLNFGCNKSSKSKNSGGSGCAAMDKSAYHQEVIRKLAKKK